VARVVGGIGASHAPSIAHAYDKGQQDDPMWRPLFEGFRPAKAWLKAVAPDVLIVVFNDHMNRFFFDAYPTFALGVSEHLPGADEGWGKRNLPDLKGDAAFGWHVARSLVADEFDPTICQEMTIDHGVLSVLPLLCDTPWPAPILPLAVNVIQHPLPMPRRLYRLGEALKRAVESYPRDMRVVIVGTGGLSHQLHGERFGYTNPDWDNRFLDLIESDPFQLTGYTHEQYMEWGGAESVEMIMWLAMRAALAPQVRRVHRHYYAPMLTGYGVLVLEN
jgi:protocatechuate 4,5-dioxygenase beta chain